MVLVVDARQAGISGDMMLSALVDAGADGDAICEQISGCAQYMPDSAIRSISFQSEMRGGVMCTRLNLDVEDPPSRPATDVVSAVSMATEHMKLSDAARRFAEKAIGHIVSAECAVHGTAPDSVHLHETASIDTLVDVAGTAAALDHINAFDADIIITPVNVGGGKVRFSHGTMTNPAPAVLQILAAAHIPIFGGPSDGETVTPTGAAILAALEGVFRPFYPDIIPERAGYGAGSRDAAGYANALLVVRGSTPILAPQSPSYDSVCVLETNLDDVTGEVVGDLISTLIKEGALDATVHTGTGKKGRPVHAVSVMCPHNAVNDIADTITRRTGALGIRITTAHRYTLPRRSHTVTLPIDGKQYTLRYKSHIHRNEAGFKVEFDDIAKAAAETGRSPRSVDEMVRRRIEEHR